VKQSSEQNLPSGIAFKCNQKEWKTEYPMVKWLQEVWDRPTGALLMTRKMLALDAFPELLNRESRNFNLHINTDLVIIPTGMTSWPPKIMDFLVNKPFNDYDACMGNGCYLGTAH
jgi:hypothetical protein